MRADLMKIAALVVLSLLDGLTQQDTLREVFDQRFKENYNEDDVFITLYEMFNIEQKAARYCFKKLPLTSKPSLLDCMQSIRNQNEKYYRKNFDCMFNLNQLSKCSDLPNVRISLINNLSLRKRLNCFFEYIK